MSKTVSWTVCPSCVRYALILGQRGERPTNNHLRDVHQNIHVPAENLKLMAEWIAERKRDVDAT